MHKEEMRILGSKERTGPTNSFEDSVLDVGYRVTGIVICPVGFRFCFYPVFLIKLNLSLLE